MAGPWEDYKSVTPSQTAPAATSAPWEDYKQPEQSFAEAHPVLSGLGEMGEQGAKAVISGVSKATDYMDQYLPSGSALRAGLINAGNANDVMQDPLGSVNKFAQGFNSQYGKPGGPSWSDVAKKSFGATPEQAPYIGTAIGTGVGLLNPEGMLIPSGANAIGKAYEAAEAAAPGAMKAITYFPKGAVNLATKTVSATTGVPEQAIKTYATRGATIDALDSSYGGNYIQYADKIKDDINSGIASAKQKWSGQVNQELKNIPDDTISLDPKDIIPSVDKIASGVNSKLPSGKQTLDEITTQVLNPIESVTGPDGTIHPKDAFDLYNDLRTKASGAYTSNGQIFNVSGPTAKAAKAAAAQVRQYMEVALPETHGAFSNYADLHDIDDVINRNMLTPGKSENALVSAGSNSINQNREQLTKLGQLTGQDYITPAENLAAMKYMGQNASTISATSTGKALVGGFLGEAAGSLVGHPEIGKVVGAAASSPWALKKGLEFVRPQELKNKMGLLRGVGSFNQLNQDKNP